MTCGTPTDTVHSATEPRWTVLFDLALETTLVRGSSGITVDFAITIFTVLVFMNFVATGSTSDVIELADALELDHFSTLGHSGGGPYGVVCVWKIPQRLHAVGIVSSSAPSDAPGALDNMRPLNRRLLQIGRRAPWLFRLLAWRVVRELRRDPDGFFAQTLNDLPGPDQDVMARAEIRKHFQDAALEAFRRGSQGAALENALYARPWGFRLQEITKQVHLWHGELDINNPPGMGRYLASAIPDCSARFYADEGHISLFVNHIEEILLTLSSATGR